MPTASANTTLFRMDKKSKKLKNLKLTESVDFSDLAGNEETIEDLEKMAPKKQRLGVKIAFLLFNVLIVVFILLAEKHNSGSIPNLRDTISETRNGWQYTLCACLLFVVMVGAEALCYVLMMRVSGQGFRPWLAIKTTIIGKYYDNITPFSMGGQPFQMYYMAKSDVSTSTACSMPVIHHVVKLLVSNIAIVACYIFTSTNTAGGIKIAAYVGVLFNLSMPAAVALFIVKKSWALAITKWVVKAGHKLKIVKDYDATLEKILKLVDEFICTLRFLFKHIGLSLIIAVLTLAEVLALVAVPYFVIRAFGVECDMWQTIVKGMYAMNASSYIPTPGSAGGAEAYFYGIFGDDLGSGNFFWAVMLWRVITYYVYIVIGTVINFGMVIFGSIKTRNYNNRLKQRIAALQSKLQITKKSAEDEEEDSSPTDGVSAEQTAFSAKDNTITEDN